MTLVPYRARLAQIVVAAGGTVEEGRYVTRPGVLVVNATAPTTEGIALLDQIGLDADLSPGARVAAFDARITYLHFPAQEARTGAEYLAEVVDVRGHTSVCARGFASVLFAGISLEASLELVANRAGKNARLTSSHTRAMDDTLYRLVGSAAEQAEQRRAIEAFLEWRAGLDAERLGGRYPRNMLNLGSRATLLHMGMSIEDWRGILQSRLKKEGNESEVREAYALACALLHDRFPHVIRTPAAQGYEP